MKTLLAFCPSCGEPRLDWAVGGYARCSECGARFEIHFLEG